MPTAAKPTMMMANPRALTPTKELLLFIAISVDLSLFSFTFYRSTLSAKNPFTITLYFLASFLEYMYFFSSISTIVSLLFSAQLGQRTPSVDTLGSLFSLVTMLLQILFPLCFTSLICLYSQKTLWKFPPLSYIVDAIHTQTKKDTKDNKLSSARQYHLHEWGRWKKLTHAATLVYFFSLLLIPEIYPPGSSRIHSESYFPFITKARSSSECAPGVKRP